MLLLSRSRTRRELTALARLRRRIQRLKPYPSLLLLIAPLAVVEPLKLISLLAAGKGHWLCGTAMIVAAYSVSLLFIERLFRIVKPKLLMLPWFATVWRQISQLQNRIAPSKLLATQSSGNEASGLPQGFKELLERARSAT
jgi:hypothetical protein